MMSQRSILYLVLFQLTIIIVSQPCKLLMTDAAGGRWQLLQKSIGISAMHMQLLNNDRVIMFDRTDFGHSKLPLPDGKCRKSTHEVIKNDCTAHSVEYNVLNNTFRPLMIQTDTWCSSGAVMPDGSLMQTGGYKIGERRIRIIKPCSDNDCDWVEFENVLAVKRWYSTDHILPDGRQIVIGGIDQFNYEFLPKKGALDL
ncbi:hypothetical protein Ddye_007199 [Dipteronia dyeriana]|uniref:Glyoxal oxidase N-terminal domain-containing protein n=1 Tax=Dipteronia dyeriana TaxID=168575 RepID=A0AAD9XK17_9ROSI|nr:hypothetical protein Ddye_007199 [Dipteronia dyeriana]